MVTRSFQRSIRFSDGEWDAVVEAAEKAGMTPGTFVRKAAARAAADDLYLYGGGLTPELVDLIKRTFRGVHLLAYLNVTNSRSWQGERSRNGAQAARIAQSDTLGEGDSDADS